MWKNFFVLYVFCNANLVSAKTLDQVLNHLNQHPLAQAYQDEALGQEQSISAKGSWGDPKLSVSAVNFPKDSLSRNQSMMTGIQVSVGQNISLSGKSSAMEDAAKEKAQALDATGRQFQRELEKSVWEMAISKYRLEELQSILMENRTWIEDNLKVSKQLYTNGKIPQQGVLDIQIRRSQIEAQISDVQYQIKALSHKLSTLLGEEIKEFKIDSSDWTYLDRWQSENKSENDYEWKKLKHLSSMAEHSFSAKKRNLIPDIQLGFSYTKRNQMDGLGDFVGASISFPIPTSSLRYGEKTEAYYQKLSSEKRLQFYESSRPKKLGQISVEIEGLKSQLKILKESTLKFAKTSRDVNAKSYARGSSDYIELLRSELQYQNQRIEKINLESQLRNQKLNYLFFKGESLVKGGV